MLTVDGSVKTEDTCWKEDIGDTKQVTFAFRIYTVLCPMQGYESIGAFLFHSPVAPYIQISMHQQRFLIYSSEIFKLLATFQHEFCAKAIYSQKLATIQLLNIFELGLNTCFCNCYYNHLKCSARFCLFWHIGYQDFVPSRTNRSKENKGYELYADLMDRAMRWIARQQGVRFTNLQTISIKIKKSIYSLQFFVLKDTTRILLSC